LNSPNFSPTKIAESPVVRNAGNLANNFSMQLHELIPEPDEKDVGILVRSQETSTSLQGSDTHIKSPRLGVGMHKLPTFNLGKNFAAKLRRDSLSTELGQPLHGVRI
jgi:hypothetical protein